MHIYTKYQSKNTTSKAKGKKTNIPNWPMPHHSGDAVPSVGIKHTQLAAQAWADHKLTIHSNTLHLLEKENKKYLLKILRNTKNKVHVHS